MSELREQTQNAYDDLVAIHKEIGITTAFPEEQEVKGAIQQTFFNEDGLTEADQARGTKNFYEAYYKPTKDQYRAASQREVRREHPQIAYYEEILQKISRINARIA